MRYLAELGLDTHLGRRGAVPAWDDDANAGLEDAPFLSPDTDLPYVVKSPWLYEFIDDLLTDVRFRLDAVVIPVRDLAEAAVSRCVIERRAIHENAPWMSGFTRSWEEWGHVPGGIIYSVNPLDQGRLLAVGFHHLVQRLVAANVSIIFLAFPRLTEDATYLFEKLRSVLPETVDHRTACSAHRRIVDPAKIRVGAEMRAAASRDKPHTIKIIGYESHAALDAMALRRELGRIRKQLAELRRETAEADERGRLETAEAAEEGRRLRARIAMMETALAEAVVATEQACRDKSEVAEALREEARQCNQKIEDLSQEILRLQQQAILDTQRMRESEIALATIRASRSWRLTRPYRAIGAKLINAFRA